MKCLNCKFFSPAAWGPAERSRCSNPVIEGAADPDFVVLDKFVEIFPARDVCDKEGDGIFVYFEAKEPVESRSFAEAA